MTAKVPVPTDERATPFHDGERAVQRRAGVAERAERLGGMLGGELSPDVASELAAHRLVVASSLDASSWPWASVLTGPAGFLRRLEDRLLLLQAHPGVSDPLAANLAVRGDLALLAIDLERRTRVRLNGRALHDPERGVFVQLDQVYGNCPKLIRRRRLEGPAPAEASSAPRRSAELDDRQRAWVAAADTFFIASAHPEAGADASHRGGPPGFVRVLDARTLAFDDQPGNAMFNTLGNLAVQPRAGLLFLDFESGAALQLRCRATLDWERGSVAARTRLPGVTLEIEEVVERPDGGVRARLLDDDPRRP